jgi:hypothetical protein
MRLAVVWVKADIEAERPGKQAQVVHVEMDLCQVCLRDKGKRVVKFYQAIQYPDYTPRRNADEQRDHETRSDT